HPRTARDACGEAGWEVGARGEGAHCSSFRRTPESSVFHTDSEALDPGVRLDDEQKSDEQKRAFPRPSPLAPSPSEPRPYQRAKRQVNRVVTIIRLAIAEKQRAERCLDAGKYAAGINHFIDVRIDRLLQAPQMAALDAGAEIDRHAEQL